MGDNWTQMLKKAISYTSGSIVANLVSMAFSTYVQYYYTDVLKGSALFIGYAASIQAVYSTVVYPLLGQLSDRTTSRYGRRVPFILYGALPLGIAFALVWSPPFKASHHWLFAAYFLCTALLYDTLFNLTMLNWSALFPELFQSPEERAHTSAWKQAFGIIGLIVGLALTPMLAAVMGWPTVGIVYGAIGTLTLLTTIPSLDLKGRRKVALAQADTGEPSTLPVLEALQRTLLNRSFASFVIMRFFVQFAFAMLTADLSYYAKYNLHLSPAEQSYVLLGTLLVALPLVYVWGLIVPRIGAFRAVLWAIGLFGAGLVPFALTRTFLTTLFCGMGIGVGLSGILMLTDVLISDVIDRDANRTGYRREGMFYGIHGLIVSLCTPAQAMVTTFVLIRTGYTASGTQPHAALLGFQWMVTVLPVAALVVGFIAMLFYPLRKRQPM